MGREIIFEVRDNNETIWPDPNNINDALYVCGRDDATGYMARICCDEDEENGTLYLSVNDYDRYLSIKKELQEYYETDPEYGSVKTLRVKNDITGNFVVKSTAIAVLY